MTDRLRGSVAVGSGFSLLVAASNAPAYIKRAADYVCDGTADDVQIQAALDKLAASPSGGTLQLSKGTFTSTSVVTYNGPGLWIRGDTMRSTTWRADNCDLVEIGTASGTLGSFNMSDMEIFESGGSSTTAVGIETLAAITQGGTIERIRASGFGGGEIIMNGATDVTIRDCYFSHNRASSTGSALLIKENAAASWGVTTIKHYGNYYTSTVAGANPMCYIQDAQTLRSIGNIYENVPSGVIGLKVEGIASPLVANDQVFVGEHFEAISGTAWEVDDVTNVVVVGANTGPSFVWTAVAAANRHATVIGPGLTGDMTNMRRHLFGLNGPNDIQSTSALQIAQVNGGTFPEAFMYKNSTDTGQASIWRTYVNDADSTAHLIGSWGHVFTATDTNQPTSRFVVSAAPDTAGTATVLDLGANDNMIGSGSSTFKKMLRGSTTWDPASLADGATASTTVTVTGATQNSSAVFVGMNQISAGGWQLSGIVTSSNTVTVTLTNHTGGTVDLGNGTVNVWVVQN